MERSATVARTPTGKKNVNRLRVPEFGVREIRLEVGGKSSKCYRPKQSPDPQPEDKGSDDFHFLPEKETVDLKYELFNPYGIVEQAKLELYSRFDEKPLWTLDLKKLGADCLDHGKHVLKWDGRIVEPNAVQKGTVNAGALEHDLTKLDPKKSEKVFPDGYVTLEHTPYKLKLIVTGGKPKIIGNPATGWTYFHLIVKKIELELGPEETVPATAVDDARHKRDKAVRKQIDDDGGVPAAGSTRKVVLLSNLFKTAGGQMNDNTAFTVYSGEWGDGANIPIIAKVRMADSADQEVKLDESDKGAVALGNVKFLWDWEDPDEDLSGQGQAKPKSFIQSAIDYYKDGTDATRSGLDHTYPKGDNSHADRGGKRGPGSKAVFPAQTGYDPKDALDAGKFPFKVEIGDTADHKRKWASLSQGWTRGKLKGCTGAVFQPSRMAGDDYKVVCYLAYDKVEDAGKVKLVLDDQAEPLKSPAAIKADTGKFQVWREIHLARYLRKVGTIAAFLPANLGAVRGYYNEPYIEVENKMEADDQYLWSDHRDSGGAEIDYNALCQAKINGSPQIVRLSTTAGADHASVDSCFLVKDYADSVQTIHTNVNGAAGAATDFAQWAASAGKTVAELAKGLGGDDLSTAPPNPRKARLQATKAFLIANAVETEPKYARYLDNQLFARIKQIARDSLELISGGKNGVGKAAKNGITIIHFNYSNTSTRDVKASGVAVGSKLGSAIDADDADRNRVVFLYVSPRTDTFVHEIGHHLFLPHTKDEGGPEARHDDADGNCVMSYNRPRDAFCGVCQLRLRGWDATKIDKTSANNKKP